MGNMPKSEAIPRGGPKGNVAERAGSSGVFVFYNYTNFPRLWYLAQITKVKTLHYPG